MTSSNGNIFRVTGHLCGDVTGYRWFPTPRPVTRSFDVFFDLRLNTRLSKESWGWLFETLSRPLWHNCNVVTVSLDHIRTKRCLPYFDWRFKCQAIMVIYDIVITIFEPWNGGECVLGCIDLGHIYCLIYVLTIKGISSFSRSTKMLVVEVQYTYRPNTVN